MLDLPRWFFWVLAGFVSAIPISIVFTMGILVGLHLR